MKTFVKFTLLLVVLCSISSYAAPRYWVSNGAGNWNIAANWSATSGGVGGAGVPTASDDVFFDGGGAGNCNINVTVNVLSFRMLAGYTSTVSQNNFTINTTAVNGIICNAGTFQGGTANINIFNGNFTIAGGNFISTSGNLVFNNAGTISYTYTSGTLNPNGGTITLSANTNFTGINHTLNKLRLAGTNNLGGITLTVNDSIVYFGGTLVLINNGTLASRGDFVIMNTAFSPTGGTGNVIFNGSTNQTLISVIGAGGFLPNVTINKASGNLIVTGQQFIRIAGNLTYTAGTITGSGFLLLWAGNSVNGLPFSIPNLAFYGGGGGNPFTFNTDVTITDTFWTLNSGSEIILNSGNILVSGNMKINNPIVSTVLGTTVIQIIGSVDKVALSTAPCGAGQLPNVVFNKLGANFTVIQQTPSAGISIHGTWTYTAGTFLGNGFVCFTNNNPISGSSQTFKNVGFTNGTNYVIDNPLIVTDTVLISGGNPINFTGNIFLQGTLRVANVNSSSSCSALSNGTITFDGTGAQSIISNSNAGNGKLPNIVINKPSGTLSLFTPAGASPMSLS